MEHWFVHEVCCCFYKSAIWPCMGYCLHEYAGAPSYSLNIWDELQKWKYRTVNHSFETLPHCLNVATLSFFSVDIVLSDVHLNCLNCFCILIWLWDPLAILIGCMIFLSPFLDVLFMSLLAVSFHAGLHWGILCLQNAFPWLIIEMVLKETMPRFSYFAGCFSWKPVLP